MDDYKKFYFAAVPMARNVAFGKYVNVIILKKLKDDFIFSYLASLND